MEKFYYAQLDINNICIAVSELKGEVDEHNYRIPKEYDPITETEIELESVFVSRMIRIPNNSHNFIGLRYNEECKWEQVIT